MKGLHDKVAIVTGGAQSIGAQIVRAFHAAGTRVTIAVLDQIPGKARIADYRYDIAEHCFDRWDWTRRP